MNFNIPKHVSPATLLRAARIAKNCKSIGFEPGDVRWGDSGDYVYFMFTNDNRELMLLFCSPACYFIEYIQEDDWGDMEEYYFMVRNIRHFLFKLRRAGFYNCEDQ
jgi:hypothetical protein